LEDSSGLGLEWNGLYTSDSVLKAFLDTKQWGGDWEGTQTIAPTNLTASSPTSTAITLSWTPIAYTGDGGGYEAFYSTTLGGPYTPYAPLTAGKTVVSMVVDGLAQSTTYYFVVRTVTDPHGGNENTVMSEFTGEVLETTTP